jgi:hypothetical protein
MKTPRIGVVGLALVLGGCASLPDTSKTDPACSRGCTGTYSQCISGFHAFPLQNQWECSQVMQSCINTCPVPGAPVTGTVASPLGQKLIDLDALHKAGLITDQEYAAKRKQILDSM